MKKAIALLLALVMVFALAACGGNKDKDTSDKKGGASAQTPGGSDSPEETPTEPQKKVYNAVGELRFDPPETYAELERYSEYKPDGTVNQAYVTYTMSDKSNFSYAFLRETDLVSRAEQQGLESEEINGVKYYYMSDGVEYYAYTQHDGDVYGVQCAVTDPEKGEEIRKDTLSALRWEEDSVLETIDTDMYGAKFAADPAQKLAGYGVTVMENAEGELQKKTVTLKHGEDINQPDFNFVVRLYKNKTLKDVQDADDEYEEKTVNGVAYSVLKTDNGTSAYDYFTQQGADVYEIRNNGQSLGWTVVRDDACVAAFEAFLNTVRFE